VKSRASINLYCKGFAETEPLEKLRLITVDRSILAAAKLPTIELSFHRGETVYVPGAPAQYAYVVVEGALCRFRVLPGGRQRVSQFLFPGDGFGYEKVRHRRDTVEALTDVKIVSARANALEAAAKSDERLSSLLFNAAARATAMAEEQSVALRGRTATEQMALFLIEMDARISSRGEIYLPTNRRHIADYFGLTIETVSRRFTAFHKARIIDFLDNPKLQRRVVIRDKRRLERFAPDAADFGWGKS
jgi:CRP/FNR family transcriptional regulator, nitrogen fixation regulation protein